MTTILNGDVLDPQELRRACYQMAMNGYQGLMRILMSMYFKIHAIKGKELTFFKRWAKAQGPSPNESLFLSERGTALHANTVNHIVRTNGERAKLPEEVQPLHAHMIRHSAGYFLRQHQGKDLAFIADRVGHNSIVSTRRYTAVDSIRDDDVDLDVI